MTFVTVDTYEVREWDGSSPQLVDFFQGDQAVALFAIRLPAVSEWMDKLDRWELVTLMVTDNLDLIKETRK